MFVAGFPIREFRPMTRLSSSHARAQRLGATIATLAVLAAFTNSAYAASQAPDISDCALEEHANDAVRACSAWVAKVDIDAATRAKVLGLRAKAWMNQEEPEAAVGDFTQAIKLDPQNAELLRSRARAYTILGTHDLAAADWAAVLGLEPKDDDAYYHRGQSQLNDGKTQEALADFDKAIEINARNIEAFIGRGRAYAKLDQRDKSMQELAAALKLDPSYIPAHLARAELADSWGQTQVAVESYQEALKYNGMNLKVRRELQRLGVFTPPN